MNLVKTIWAEFIGLFVDDGSFAAAVLGWLIVCWLLLPRLGLPAIWPPIILPVGLAVILAESTLRRARQAP